VRRSAAVMCGADAVMALLSRPLDANRACVLSIDLTETTQRAA